MSSSRPLSEPVFRQSGECAVRKVGEETILVPIRSRAADLESVFVTNDVGRAIWEMLESPKTVDRIVERIIEKFDVAEATARKDAVDFLHALIEARLIEESGEAR